MDKFKGAIVDLVDDFRDHPAATAGGWAAWFVLGLAAGLTL